MKAANSHQNDFKTIHRLRLRMNLKERASTAYQQLAEFHDNRDGYTPETQCYFLTDVLTDLVEAAKMEGCEINVPDNPSSMQAINVVNDVLDWARKSDDSLFF